MTLTSQLTIEEAWQIIAYLGLSQSWHEITINMVTATRSPQLVAEVRSCLATLEKVSQAKLKAIDDPNYGLVQADVLKWNAGSKEAGLVALENEAKFRLRQLLGLDVNFGKPIKLSQSLSVPTQIVL